MNRWCGILICTLVFPVVIGCHRSPTTPVVSGPPARVVRVIPSELFTPELDRLAPHLDLVATGCVRLEAPGEDLFFGFEPEIWERGEPRPLGSWSQSRVRGPSEASFSVREADDAKEGRVYRVVASVADASGQRASYSFTVAVPDVTGLSRMGRAVDLAGPRELTAGEAAVPVWAFVIRTDGRMGGEPLEEAVKTARWALVVKARWERPESR